MRAYEPWKNSNGRPPSRTSRSTTRPTTIVWSPPGYCASSRQSTYAIASSSTGAPETPLRQGVARKRSAPFVANSCDSASWCSPRMLTANTPARSMRGHVEDECATQNNTSGGSSDNDANAFAAIPTGSSSSIAVMMVTPVAKFPSTSRKRRSSGVTTTSPAGGSAIACCAAELDGEAVGRGEDLRTARARDEVARVAQDRVHRVVAVRWTVVEQRELARTGFARDVDRVLDGAVTPVALLLVLGSGVLRVVDHEVRAVAQLEHVVGHVEIGIARHRAGS